MLQGAGVRAAPRGRKRPLKSAAPGSLAHRAATIDASWQLTLHGKRVLPPRRAWIWSTSTPPR